MAGRSHCQFSTLTYQSIDYMICGRGAMVTLSSPSRSVAVSRGCPQGGVLLPFLWCLVVNELLTRLSGEGVYAQGYADDICLLAVGKFLNAVSGLIQWARGTVEAWCGKHGLLVNPDKTGLVAFMRKRKLPGFFNPVYSERYCNALCQSSIWE